MKIALIVEWLDASRGGAETSTIQFIRHLADLGIEVEVITRSDDAGQLPCRVHSVHVASPSRTLAARSFYEQADRCAVGIACDLVHSLVPSMVAHIYQPRGGTFPETRLRNVATRRSRMGRMLKRIAFGLDAKYRLMAGLERKMLGRPDGPHVIALSDYVTAQLHEHYGLANGRITKIFNGVDPVDDDDARRSANRSIVRKRLGISDSGSLALFAANNFRLKGLASWLAALAKLKDMASVRAVIVGNGDTQPWLKMVSELGISERITFAGPTNDIAAYYQAADMLVHPTYYDPCSRVVLEAQSIGLPCVTTKFDGAAEVIEDGVNGYVVKSPDDIGAIASAVRKIAEGKLLPTTDRSTPSTVSGFTMRKHAEHVVKLYEKLLNMRRD